MRRDSIYKRLEELERAAPSHIKIELTYFDDTSEVLSLAEVLEKNNTCWKRYRVIEGNNIKEVARLLSWLAPQTCID